MGHGKECYWHLVGRGQGCSKYPMMCKTTTVSLCTEEGEIKREGEGEEEWEEERKEEEEEKGEG